MNSTVLSHSEDHMSLGRSFPDCIFPGKQYLLSRRQQIIQTASAPPESVLFKAWNFSRAKQGVFQERAGRKFRKTPNKIPLPFPKHSFPSPNYYSRTEKQMRSSIVLLSWLLLALSTRTLNIIISLTEENQKLTPVTQTH